LRNVTSVLNDQRIDCWGDDYGGTRDDFLQGRWKDVIGSAPLMVYPLCVNMFQVRQLLLLLLVGGQQSVSAVHSVIWHAVVR
jgi:hypothetical protein